MSEPIPSEKGYTPFELGQKIAEGHTASVYEAQKNPDLLVKRVSIITEDFDSPAKETRRSYTLDAFRYHYQRNLLDMRKHVGNFMPNTELVYGLDENGDPCGWVITEKITKTKELATEERLRALDMVMSALVDMYLSKFEKEGRDYGDGLKLVEMPDFLGHDGGEDLMYGSTKSNSHSQYYLPDIYPMFECGPIMLSNEIRDKIRPYGYLNFPRTTEKLVKLEKFVPRERHWEIKA